jgi:hypothetical protein
MSFVFSDTPEVASIVDEKILDETVTVYLCEPEFLSKYKSHSYIPSHRHSDQRKDMTTEILNYLQCDQNSMGS